jgi:uncharacterized protein YqjF (DUF2071 family)
MAFAKMRWGRSLLVHWRLPAVELEARVPLGLELDRAGVDAFVTLVALEVAGPAPLPRFALRRLLRYRQINLRTYVVGPRGPGIHLLDTRVDRLLPALGARAVGMPYWIERPLELGTEPPNVWLRTPAIEIAGRAAAATHAVEPGTLDGFLLDRFWAYGRLPGGLLYAVCLRHDPWQVRDVQVLHHSFTSAAGIAVEEQPFRAHLGEPQEVSVRSLALVDKVAPLLAELPSPA